MNLTRFIKNEARANVWSCNEKTGGVAVDFGICPLMTIKSDSSKKGGVAVTSPACHGCYSAHVIQVFPAVRQKLQRVESKPASAADFKADLRNMLAGRLLIPDDTGQHKLRFFALGDFVPRAMPFIHAARDLVTVDILSKTLCLPHNEAALRELINLSGVWVSLSFNETFLQPLARIKNILRETRAGNVQLNYTLDADPAGRHFEAPTTPFFDQFQVLHSRNRKTGQRAVLVDRWGIDESRVCGVFDYKGGRVKGKGSCSTCHNCHVAFGDTVAATLPRLAEAS